MAARSCLGSTRRPSRFLDQDDGRPALILNSMRCQTDMGPGRLKDALFRMRAELARYGAWVAYVGETTSPPR